MSIQRMLEYTPLALNDAGDNMGSSEKLLAGNGEAIGNRQSALHHCRPWLVHLGILSLYTIAFLALSTHVLVQNQTEDCFLQESIYSPAHKAIKYSMVRFNGSLDFPSPYNGFGHRSPALDEAWDRITTNSSMWPIRLSDEDLQKINKAGRASNVRYHEADGGGSMGSIEIFHQLHCLNMLRQYTYPKEYSKLHKHWNERPKRLRSHLDHCIDVIRQRLMCVADVGVLTYDWVTGWDVPIPDPNTYHKCRDFDRILDWVTENRVHIPQDHMVRIGNEIDLPELYLPD